VFSLCFCVFGYFVVLCFSGVIVVCVVALGGFVFIGCVILLV